MTYRAIRCPCGHPVCKAWMVDPAAATQGVYFSEAQAHAVAALLNSDFVPPVPEDGCDLILTHVTWKEGRRL